MKLLLLIKDEIFWAAIATSLSVMISNNLISMFSLDRRYIMYAVTAEKLKAVGWKYFELSDMFSTKIILKIGYYSGMKLKKLKNYKLLPNLQMIVKKIMNLILLIYNLPIIVIIR